MKNTNLIVTKKTDNEYSGKEAEGRFLNTFLY
jgi:hypothetical protein